MCSSDLTKKQQAARAGELLVAEIDAKVGGFGIIPPELDGAIVSSHYYLYAIDEEKCLRGWLNAFIRAGGLEEQVKARGTTNYAAIRPECILDFEIPLPPLPEQRRIVARIEELAAKIEEARGLRRGSIIQTDALESSATAEAFASLSRAPRLSIQELAEVRGGIQKGPHRAAGSNPVRYLTVAHVQRNYICLSDPRFFEVSPEELERWRLEAGDVLIIEGNGSPAQIGRAALFRGEIPDCVQKKPCDPDSAEPKGHRSRVPYFVPQRPNRSRRDSRAQSNNQRTPKSQHSSNQRNTCPHTVPGSTTPRRHPCRRRAGEAQ